ncbi:MAG: hypothetical protein MJA83_20315 [Gammaproteobacteria bacterium]|nr:hypothetical protein [Gammaproteobacteria bacterium]
MKSKTNQRYENTRFFRELALALGKVIDQPLRNVFARVETTGWKLAARNENYQKDDACCAKPT